MRKVKLRVQSFTSLMAYLCQYINRVSSYSMCLNGTFSWWNCSVTIPSTGTLTQMKRVTITNYQSLNGALPSRNSSIKAPAKWKTSLYVCNEVNDWAQNWSMVKFSKKKKKNLICTMYICTQFFFRYAKVFIRCILWSWWDSSCKYLFQYYFNHNQPHSCKGNFNNNLFSKIYILEQLCTYLDRSFLYSWRNSSCGKQIPSFDVRAR